MKIAIRVNSSGEIGGGHVMRCLSLAKAFEAENHEVIFITSNLHGNINLIIEDNGYKQFILTDESKAFINIDKVADEKDQLKDAENVIKIFQKENIDMALVDCYNLDYKWESIIKNKYPLMVIEDFPSRKHQCDIFLDSTFGRDKSEYSHKISYKEGLFGEKFIPIRGEFFKERNDGPPNISKKVRQILLTMGSVDKKNTLLRILYILEKLKLSLSDIKFNVLAGSSNNNINSIINFASDSSLDLNIISNSNNVSKLISDSDMVVSAAGTTLWECFCLGAPLIAIKTASNQKSNVEICERNNLSKTCDIDNNFSENFSSTFLELINNFSLRKELSLNAFNGVDGNGAIRVVKFIEKYYETI